MIHGILHTGSGLGNQLHRYVATRVLAEDKGLEFSMIGQENFKGKDFMEVDLGKPNNITYSIGPGGEVLPNTQLARFSEKKVLENGVDIRSYDPEINFVEDNTIIDGEFQDSKYFNHRLEDVAHWLKTKQLWMPDDTCVIGFRGGEFQYIPDLFLPREYYEDAMKLMRDMNPNMKFMAVTDDPATASKILPPEVKITHEIATDWRMIRCANYLIISNSSFYILPALLNKHAKMVLAPRFWARRNTGTWALPSNYYPQFRYI